MESNKRERVPLTEVDIERLRYIARTTTASDRLRWLFEVLEALGPEKRTQLLKNKEYLQKLESERW